MTQLQVNISTGQIEHYSKITDPETGIVTLVSVTCLPGQAAEARDILRENLPRHLAAVGERLS